MRLGNRQFTRIALLAVLVLGLLGGLFHHHQSDSDCASCPLCHVGVQTPVENLVCSLVIPLFNTIGTVSLAQPHEVGRIDRFDPTIPRGPPSRIPLVISGKSRAGLV